MYIERNTTDMQEV